MDYKKKYEDALENLKELRDDWKRTGNRAAKEIEAIFPELAESEDERIRKAILRYFNKEGEIDGIHNRDICAWLEKQKEHKPVELEDINVRAMAEKYRCTDEYDDEGKFLGKPLNCMVTAYGKGIRDILKIVKHKPAMIQWTGDNLKEVIEFTGKSPKFDEWFNELKRK